MLNASSRTVRGSASPVFDHMMKDDDGLSVNRSTPPYAAEQKDKTGAHSIAALNRFICDAKNGSTYSNSIKAAIGEKPDPVNPYIISKQSRPLPDEKFSARGKLANNCGCGKKPIIPGTPKEPFLCGCGEALVEHSSEILTVGPIVLVILIIAAALLVSKIVICRLKRAKDADSSAPAMEGGAIDADFDSII